MREKEVEGVVRVQVTIGFDFQFSLIEKVAHVLQTNLHFRLITERKKKQNKT